MSYPGYPKASPPPSIYGDQSKSEVPASPIQAANQVLESEINELHAALVNLEVKLEPICPPQPPASGGQGVTSQTNPMSLLTSTTLNAASRVRDAALRVGQLINRIEI